LSRAKWPFISTFCRLWVMTKVDDFIYSVVIGRHWSTYRVAPL
jgi:hypothetical protein